MNAHSLQLSQTTAPVVVLGAGYAGLVTALRLAPHVPVTLVDPKRSFTERVRLHQLAAGRPSVSHPLAALLRGTGVHHVAARAVDLDLAARHVRTDDGDVLPYARLVYALGSVTNTPSSYADGQAGGDGRLHTAETAAELHRRLLAGKAGRVVVVGGGLTGIEMASEIAEAYPAWEVGLVTAGMVGAGLSAKGRAHVLAVLAGLGVRVEEGRPVASADEVDADVVVWAAAVRPVNEPARAAGLALDREGRVAVDGRLRSVSDASVYVVGDAAGTGLRMSCAVAIPAGMYGAASVRADLGGRRLRDFSYRFSGQCISLGRGDALVQWVHGDDTPRPSALTGRPAVLLKERIVRSTVGFVRLAAARARWGGGSAIRQATATRPVASPSPFSPPSDAAQWRA
ncbi:NAD(P)/FAD-dependent oxidoreductase [Streptomyces mashuensis]|nr:FAD-dependent oxidoreductase [Streptomyces mashuensis]